MTEQELWFAKQLGDTNPLGGWAVCYRPTPGDEQQHGIFPTQEQAVAVVNVLNELGQRAPTTKQADGDSGTTEADKGYG